jgi:uncharacterized protein (TIGR00369 family)
MGIAQTLHLRAQLAIAAGVRAGTGGAADRRYRARRRLKFGDEKGISCAYSDRLQNRHLSVRAKAGKFDDLAPHNRELHGGLLVRACSSDVENPFRGIECRSERSRPAAKRVDDGAQSGKRGAAGLPAECGPVMDMIGFRLVKVEMGATGFEYDPAEPHYNPIGSVHGGILTTVLDTAMGSCIHTTLPVGVGFTTLEVKVNFVRPVFVKTGVMRCEGNVIHSGSRIVIAEARLFDKQGKLYAHSNTTCLLLSE